MSPNGEGGRGCWLSANEYSSAHEAQKYMYFGDLTPYLKVFTNEKRVELILISFDRPPFKLLSQKFSKESVQAPSCERHKTTQLTLFLLFADNF
jgi:hypothetical protein